MYNAYHSRKHSQKLSETDWAKDLYKSPYETEAQAAENEKRPTNWDMYTTHSDQNVTIKVVGVFDTVGSLGLPDGVVNRVLGTGEKYKFHNTKLDPSTIFILHILTITANMNSRN